jgi:hypothetical protein
MNSNKISYWLLLYSIAAAGCDNWYKSNQYSWTRNYQDNAARRRRAHDQLRACLDYAHGLRTPSQHVISYYCGKGTVLRGDWRSLKQGDANLINGLIASANISGYRIEVEVIPF